VHEPFQPALQHPMILFSEIEMYFEGFKQITNDINSAYDPNYQVIQKAPKTIYKYKNNNI
jgi:hypothetical protein